MERKCEECRYNINEQMCEACDNNYSAFEPIEKEKTMDNLEIMGSYNCIKCGKKLAYAGSCGCKSETMEKKYRVLKLFHRFVDGGIYRIGQICTDEDLKDINKERAIDNGYIEEIKEDTLDRILYDTCGTFHKEHRIRIEQYIVKQKIELLKELNGFVCTECQPHFIKAISELEKEIGK